MVKSGLKDIVVLRSGISCINGEKGVLEYRGYDARELAKYSTYEEVAFLLWSGYLPEKKELEKFSLDLARRRELPTEIIELLYTLPKITHPTVVLRTAISYLGSLDKRLHLFGSEENLEKSKNLLAKIPTIIASYQRIREGKDLVPPNENFTHAENFLHMLRGQKFEKIESKALEADLILHAEHGLNPSTFSSRISASTLSDMYAGVVSATGTLFGILHGGASQAVVKMLREIKLLKERKKGNIDDWVRRKLQNKEKIMGFGHRVYKVEDPRAKELKIIAAELDKIRDNQWTTLSEELVEAVQKRKNLYPNVDFYTAAVYVNLGIPDDLFINIFVAGRIAGWTAHIMEQYKDNKVIRPIHEYIGEKNKIYPREKSPRR
jgi:citrate synthase